MQVEHSVGIFPMFILLPIIAVLGLAATAFWIWMIVDCVSKEPSEGNDKIIWLLVIILLGWIGGLVYLIARRPKRIALYGS